MLVPTQCSFPPNPPTQSPTALQAAVAAGLDPELGNPTQRKPKTAILNFVRYHTEVVAVAAFHFVKLRHNVTVFTREDEFDMGDVMNPYFWKGFRCGVLGWVLAGWLGC